MAPSRQRVERQQGIGIPRRGYVLSSVANTFGLPIRKAVTILADVMEPAVIGPVWNQLYARRVVEPGCDANTRPTTEMAAWAVVSVWILGVSTKAISYDASLVESETWFLGRPTENGLAAHVPPEARNSAEKLLHPIADPDAFAALLPYIVDPHGEGSRLSVRRRPETAAARERKKADGVFYTPMDVAGYMAAQTLSTLADDVIPLTVFDPACGTGVFLRAVLAELVKLAPQAASLDLACSSLYGVDIDSWAVCATSFVILHDCIGDIASRRIPPIAAWHAIRLNFAHLDALRLDPGRALPEDDPTRLARLECRALLKAGQTVPVRGTALPTGCIPFDEVFAEIAEGPRVIIGNPPYADIGPGSDLLALSKRFATLRASPRESADIYPLFVEQMARLTAPNAHGGAMVLPLSAGCNTGAQFVALRRTISQTPGSWRFAFFDREPHALFGEDVKTRNAIVLWSRHGADSKVEISTGPLRKWRGEDRAKMFSSITFTPIALDIQLGIPKLEGSSQATALRRLYTEGEERTLAHAVTGIGRATLAEALNDERHVVYVGATAYNFLNVFLRPAAPSIPSVAMLTENPLHAIVCPSQEVALQVFGLLSSGLAFWWWHVHGDGFHVSKNILETLPFGSLLLNIDFADRATPVARRLWQALGTHPIVSVNRGRTSFGFNSSQYDERGQIDALLVDALGLDQQFVNTLARFSEVVRTAHTAHE